MRYSPDQQKILDDFWELSADISRTALEDALHYARIVNHTAKKKTATTETVFVTEPVGRMAYRLVLEEDEHPYNALMLAISVLKADWDMLDSLNKNCCFIPSILTAYANHPIQKRMIELGLIDLKLLGTSRSLNQLLRRLKNALKHYEHILKLEEKAKIYDDNEIKFLIWDRFGYEYDKSPAGVQTVIDYLLLRGCKVKDIALELGVSLTTVYNRRNKNETN